MSEGNPDEINSTNKKKLPVIFLEGGGGGKEYKISGGHMVRLHLGKVHRGTSKKLGAFLEVLFSLVLLCFEGRKSSKKFLRNLSLCSLSMWPP